MLKKMIVITFLVFLSMLNCRVEAQELNEMEEVKNIATHELRETLNRMPFGGEQAYGFRSREEFSNAKIGSLIITESIGHDSTVNFNRYRFMVSVNGEPRALLSYKKEGEIWVMCGFGATNLAREVSAFDQSMRSDFIVAHIVRINNTHFKGDFIKLDSSFKQGIPQNELIPMQSAKSGLIQENRKTTSVFTLQEILQLGVEK